MFHGAETEVTLKKEKTDEWSATFDIERDREQPTKPENPEKCADIGVGILKYAHDTDGSAIGSLTLSDARRRLEREQMKMSNDQQTSVNFYFELIISSRCIQTTLVSHGG